MSTHRTLVAAQEAISRANRRLRKIPGNATAWHPYAIVREYYWVREYCTDARCPCDNKTPVLIAECHSLSDARSYHPSPGYEIQIEKREETL